MGAAHEGVVILEDIVAGVEDEQDQVGAVLPPLALPEEQLAVGAVAGDARVEDLDPVAEALLEELRERRVLLHLHALGEGVAEDEDAELALALVRDVAVAEPVPVDARVRAPLDLAAEAALRPAPCVRRVRPADPPIRFPEHPGIVAALQTVHDPAPALGQQQADDQAEEHEQRAHGIPGRGLSHPAADEVKDGPDSCTHTPGERLCAPWVRRRQRRRRGPSKRGTGVAAFWRSRRSSGWRSRSVWDAPSRSGPTCAPRSSST